MNDRPPLPNLLCLDRALAFADPKDTFEELLELLKNSNSTFLLLKEEAQEICPGALRRVCELLEQEPDLAAVGHVSSEADAWDVGQFVDFDGVVFRSATLEEVVRSGFQPLLSISEFQQAVRHTGWRVQATNEALVKGPRLGDSFLAGRVKHCCELYDTSVEQLLAGGPRLLKRSLIYFATLAFKRWLSRRRWKEGAGYLFQAGLSALLAHRTKLARGSWRKSKMQLDFPSAKTAKTAVILFTALRPWYLRRALRALHRHWPKEEPVHLVISQDGPELSTENLIKSLGNQVTHLRFRESVKVPWRDILKGWIPYYRIAQHYGYGLTKIFAETDAEQVIILEDDHEVGPDFFGYLDHCRKILEQNPDLLAASAWNDHGHLAADPGIIHRTDCFPGHGWLLTRSNWESIAAEWPETLWDEWIREPEVLQGRQFLRPELSRVRNFGRSGTGSSDFFDRAIQPVKILETAYSWSDKPLDFAIATYRRNLMNQIEASQAIQSPADMGEKNAHIFYQGEDEFNELAESLGIVPGFRPHAPRAAFEGIVILRVNSHQLFLVPKDTL